jgi:hypothetical protein
MVEFDIIVGEELETGVEFEAMSYADLISSTPVLSETEEGEYRLKVDDSLLFDEIPALPRSVCVAMADGLPDECAGAFEPSFTESVEVASAYRVHVGNLLAFADR